MNTVYQAFNKTPKILVTLAGIVLILLLTVVALLTLNPSQVDAATASATTDYYTDNAGGKQPIQIVKTEGEKVPAIIFVYGGGWAVDGFDFDRPFQDDAAKNGYTSFRIKYRLMAGGVYEQLEDVMRATRHIKQNAASYNIDPEKIVIWGDSAGGSLAVRAAASGKSGTAAAVGWSAPTNAFRDLFNSPQSFADGLFHSRCFGGYIRPLSLTVLSFIDDTSKSWLKLGSGKALSQKESMYMVSRALQTSNIVLTDLPSTFGRLAAAPGDLGFTVTGNPGDLTDTGKSTTAPLSGDELTKKLKALSPEELTQLGTSIFEFSRSMYDNPIPEDAKESNTISTIAQGLQDIVNVQDGIYQQKLDAEKLTGSNIPLIQSDNLPIGINPQQVSTEKLQECIDDFIQLSPALTASPRTPPMFLATYTKDALVNVHDAYQMRDKLRSMGIKSDTFTIKGPGHMVGKLHQKGRPETYRFIDAILNTDKPTASTNSSDNKEVSKSNKQGSGSSGSTKAGTSGANESPPSKSGSQTSAVPKPETSTPNTNSQKGFRSITGSPLYVFQASDWKNRPKAIYNNQVGKWYGNWTGNIQGEVSQHVGKAASKGSLPLLVVYNIPNRDCGSYSAGGAGSSGAYRSWIDKLAAGIGKRKAIVILEPDAVPQTDCLNAANKKQRITDISYAVNTLKSKTESSVYIDAGHPRWKSANSMATLLKQVNVANATGFSINVSNFIPTNENIKYGDSIVAELKRQGVPNARYVIDTSRNGRGALGSEWCNPRGRGLGTKPTTRPGGSPSLDAFLWIKTPGESDGECGRGDPAAGQWFPSYADELIRNAAK